MAVRLRSRSASPRKTNGPERGKIKSRSRSPSYSPSRGAAAAPGTAAGAAPARHDKGPPVDKDGRNRSPSRPEVVVTSEEEAPEFWEEEDIGDHSTGAVNFDDGKTRVKGYRPSDRVARASDLWKSQDLEQPDRSKASTRRPQRRQWQKWNKW